MGVEVSFYESIMSNFMVCQDRLETNLLQLFAHPKFSERLCIISGSIFEVNVLSRVFAVVKFLSSPDWPFRRREEKFVSKHNGNN